MKFTKSDGKTFVIVFFAVAAVFVAVANRERFGKIPFVTDFLEAIHDGTDG